MKFTLATLIAAVAVASASPARKDITPGAIKASSKLGKRVLSQARRLDDNQNDNNNNQNQNQNEEIDFGWVADYSIKFQGCHHINQWNEEADGEDDPFIQTKRLVRFRLCPTETCTYEDAGGCDSGYGDYIIDMNIFLENYWQDKLENCEVYAENTCNCENANNQEYCEYDCLMDAGMEYCIEENPYEQDNGDNGDEYEEIEIEQAMECAQWDIDENAYYNYQYNNNNNNNANRRKLEEEVQYFIGPYCSDQGGKIFLGVFTDEFCTNFADNQDGEGSSHTEFYYKMTGGHALPYSSESLVDMDCVSAKEYQEQDQNNDNDNQDADEVKEAWEQVYAQAGKCESQLDNAYLFYPNENACNYIEGIKIVRKDGIVVQGAAAKSKTAAIFIGIFAVSFVLLGAYVYYLKTKLDRAKINLSE
mmetsp:Transcript_38056/g.82779  ORF Transcript_38056/g.82779 Transcript_38056/m.82779 type:complete len:419 (-) Transcript_38056:287-1543(-)